MIERSMMRVDRFQQYLLDLVRGATTAAVSGAETFAEAGHTEHPTGVVLRLANGGQVWVQLVRTSPDGGDAWAEPERIVEGSPASPVPMPTLDAGRVRMADLEAWLVALIANAGSREIAAVRGFSTDPRSDHPFGFAVRFHSGAVVFGLPLFTMPSGRSLDPSKQYQPLEAV